jgi:hypothetical protein
VTERGEVFAVAWGEDDGDDGMSDQSNRSIFTTPTSKCVTLQYKLKVT